MQPVTSPTLTVTHFYFGKGGWVVGGVCVWGGFIAGDWVSSQCHSAVAHDLIPLTPTPPHWKVLVEITHVFVLTPLLLSILFTCQVATEKQLTKGTLTCGTFSKIQMFNLNLYFNSKGQMYGFLDHSNSKSGDQRHVRSGSSIMCVFNSTLMPVMVVGGFQLVRFLSGSNNALPSRVLSFKPKCVPRPLKENECSLLPQRWMDYTCGNYSLTWLCV